MVVITFVSCNFEYKVSTKYVLAREEGGAAPVAMRASKGFAISGLRDLVNKSARLSFVSVSINTMRLSKTKSRKAW